MKRHFLMLHALLCCLVSCVAVAADSGKTAFVNMETVFNEYYKTVNENISFEGKRKTLIDGWSLLREEYDGTVAELKKMRAQADNELLAADVRDTAKSKAQLLLQRIEEKQREMLRFRQQGMAEIEQRQQQVMNDLIAELREILAKYAKENGYTMVLEVSGRTMNRMPAVLVYPPEQEITEAVVKLVNAGHEQEKRDADARLKELRAKSAAAARAAGMAVPPGMD